MNVNLYLKKCCLIALVLCALCARAQQRKKIRVSKPPSIEEAPAMLTQAEINRINKNSNCARRKGTATALRVYPFNNSIHVQLVSFETGKGERTDTTQGSMILLPPVKDSLPRMNDTVCYSALREVKTLTYSQADILADVLFNYDFAGDISYGNGMYRMGILRCHHPHNATLFVNEEGKVFEYISVCFGCRSLRVSFKGCSDDDNMCEQKMGMIKKVFEKAGIVWGVNGDISH